MNCNCKGVDLKRKKNSNEHRPENVTEFGEGLYIGNNFV